MAAALNTPVSVLESAGEGGAWGIALLAAYMRQGSGRGSLEQFLAEKVFAGKTGAKAEPDPKDVESFNQFMRRYAQGLAIERAAAAHLQKG
jgi:sugar (pentulose or hexulose) kinase